LPDGEQKAQETTRMIERVQPSPGTGSTRRTTWSAATRLQAGCSRRSRWRICTCCGSGCGRRGRRVSGTTALGKADGP